MLTQNRKHISRLLDDNFASVFTIENMESSPGGAPPPRKIGPLKADGIREDEIKRYLVKLEANKSTGPDDLSQRLLKELKQQIL